MKNSILLPLTTLLGLTASLFASPNAETIFDNKCAMCHIKTMPKDFSTLVAPPLMGVMRHVKMAYPKKEDAVNFMIEYVQNPSKSKAVCMPQKIARFGLMPSQKENITKKELQKVTSWMFDNYPPANFAQSRMSNRPTFAMFDANGDGIITKEEFTAFRMKRMSTRGQMSQNKQKVARGTFAQIDTNGDGKISKDELVAKKGFMANFMFGKIDKDDNGFISQEEFNTFRMQRQQSNQK